MAEQTLRPSKEIIHSRIIAELSLVEGHYTELYLQIRGDLDVAGMVSDMIEKVQKLKHYAITGL